MSGRDVLIVEDDEAIATGLSLNLRLAGHRPTVARDGDEALARVDAADFDMVLLDINLPRRNGLEVLQAIRASDNVVPVIVVSARDGETDKVAALRLGADDYVTKPFDIEELKLRVKNSIEASKRQTQIDSKSNLPSGRLIEDQLRKLMHSAGAWAYVDIKINDFDAFTEVYGFVAGDDVIRFMALLMNEVVEECGTPEDFLGHPGRDNFIVITHAKDIDRLKQRLAERFNAEVQQHYSFIDRERGYVLVPDGAQGERQANLMTLATGSVSTQTHQFADIREITELAAEDRRRGLSGEDAGPKILTSW